MKTVACLWYTRSTSNYIFIHLLIPLTFFKFAGIKLFCCGWWEIFRCLHFLKNVCFAIQSRKCYTILNWMAWSGLVSKNRCTSGLNQVQINPRWSWNIAQLVKWMKQKIAYNSYKPNLDYFIMKIFHFSLFYRIPHRPR